MYSAWAGAPSLLRRFPANHRSPSRRNAPSKSLQGPSSAAITVARYAATARTASEAVGGGAFVRAGQQAAAHNKGVCATLLTHPQRDDSGPQAPRPIACEHHHLAHPSRVSLLLADIAMARAVAARWRSMLCLVSTCRYKSFSICAKIRRGQARCVNAARANSALSERARVVTQ
jgi:hypothetical protein